MIPSIFFKTVRGGWVNNRLIEINHHVCKVQPENPCWPKNLEDLSDAFSSCTSNYRTNYMYEIDFGTAPPLQKSLWNEGLSSIRLCSTCDNLQWPAVPRYRLPFVQGCSPKLCVRNYISSIKPPQVQSLPKRLGLESSSLRKSQTTLL